MDDYYFYDEQLAEGEASWTVGPFEVSYNDAARFLAITATALMLLALILI